MTRAEYKQLVHELNQAYRFAHGNTYSDVYAIACLQRARSMVVKMGRPQ